MGTGDFDDYSENAMAMFVVLAAVYCLDVARFVSEISLPVEAMLERGEVILFSAF